MSLKSLIKNREKNKNLFTWNGIQVIIKDPILNPNISLQSVLTSIEKKISKHLLRNVDIIYVGNFDFLNDKNVQAVYENSCIFVTNNQEDQQDMADDIIHEIAHSLEEIYSSHIYQDQELEKEFLNKRKQLYLILKSEDYEVSLQDFLNPSYEERFDSFLYKTIGYPALNILSANIFYSPYAATSIREYFANGFEAYFYYESYSFIKNNCPVLYQKLKFFEEEQDEF